VLHVLRPSVGTSAIGSISSVASLPSQLLSDVQSVQSLQASWRDTDGFTWNFDPINGNLNWWKQNNDIRPMMADEEKAPINEAPVSPTSVDRAKAIAAADSFLDAHGLGIIRAQGGTIEEQAWMTGSSMPCLMGAVEDSSGAVSSMMYPNPCGWYGGEVTIYYGAQLEGRSVVDVGGWPFRLSSVQINLEDYSVRGGNVIMNQQTERSSYPLISREEAMKRLEAGGRSPMYRWGDGQEVSVEIDKIELAWMRYDSWNGEKQETYYLPALSATGKVNYTRAEAQEYHTVVLLVADDAFDLGDNGGVMPSPVPMPVEPMMIEGAEAVSSPPEVAR
jgi:hypothetical protein